SESTPFVAERADGLRGLAKPGSKKSDGIARAAHEKIASDLAYHLELPVPPVTLWDRGEGSHAERYVAISAWAFPTVFSWDEATSRPRGGRGDGPGKWPFETWIGATDRKSDHALVSKTTDGSLQLAFIDYAYSLSYVWSGPNAPLGAAPWYCPTLKNDAVILA